METLIALTPAHHLDPQIAIAAVKAGGIGVLDLGYRDRPDALSSALDRLASAAPESARWGVRWDMLGSEARDLRQLSARLPYQVPILILAGPAPAELTALRKRVKSVARRIFVEVHDFESAQAAIAAGCDGLIIKGHEAGGSVSRHSSFILLQELKGRLSIPYWIQGGIGLRSAAAAMLAGANGVVLCEQLWLTEESPLAHSSLRGMWSQLDGSETVLLAQDEAPFRLFARSGRDKLQELEQRVIRGEPWRDLLAQRLAENDDAPLPLGQDIAFAAPLARRFGTVGHILTAMKAGMDSTIEQAASDKALSADSPLARKHGTRFPIVQGPMTRVSDTAPFAKAVAEAGGLPFLALSVMRKPQVESLLSSTRAIMGDLPWGVGLLGFMPLELRQEQLDVIREIKPPFAIIAGGRPSQARELETLSITTYLHVPSPGLLSSFIKEGARKFIFEGSECGGHTGPRTSFILWESAIEVLAAAQLEDPESVQVLFAGGIHDELSAAMLSVLAAPLTARGMSIGVVMGTAYLFTEEIVRTGAIVNEFQAQAVACRETALLQSGVGVYTRCAKTEFCDEFNRTRRELQMALESEERTLKVLELLNIGRLRIASKGIAHKNQPALADDGDRYVKVNVQTQRREGMYMLGEVARLRNNTLTVAQLHAAVSAGSQELLAGASPKPEPKRWTRPANREDIAIIGMACLLPGASDVRSYWQNILRRVDTIREVSDDRWRPADFFDPKRGTPDKIYSKWGGFLDDVPFDPTVFGIPPASLRSIEPMQLLALDVAKRALEDAGLDRRPFPRERTSAIFASGGMNDLGTIYIFRTLLAHYLPKVPGLSETTRKHIMQTLYEHALPNWTEDSFPGFLGNVVAGRVANRLDLGGTNFAVDAACASSLAALDVAIKQLRNGDADVALVGSIDGTNNAVAFMAFAQTHALSPRGRCRPFDDNADGIAIGEGVAALVLKRLSEAERDGDRIYAVIKGIGASSDGRNRSLTAPHPQGQVRALRRAYEDAGVDPSTVGLIEAHGTGTAVGDKSEIESINTAFGECNPAPQSCAVGSVKSMIGHTKVSAGFAGMIKAALALKHRVLPPTLGVETPNSRVDFTHSPFYINTETRPWFARDDAHPRRCGVSAFGFGGTNFHAVLEEYGGDYRDADAIDLSPRDAEPFLFFGPTRSHIVQAVERLQQGLEYPEHLDLAQLAYSLQTEQRQARDGDSLPASRLALIATSVADLKQKLDWVLRDLRDGTKTEIRYPQGVYYRESDAAAGALCFVFPGQGSQKINMLRDLVATLPELHRVFERADVLLAERLPQPLSRFIYPLPAFSDEEREKQQSALNATQIAQPALGAVELAAFEILEAYGIRPAFAAGHSYGEYVALCAAGALDRDDLIRLSEIRGRIAAEAGQNSRGTMAAVDADGARVEALIAEHGLAVSVANLNAPDQTIVAGPADAMDAALAVFAKASLRTTKLAVRGAFHCSAMADASTLLAAELSKIEFRPPEFPIFSNTTADRYPHGPAEIRALLARHLAEPVRFVDEVNRLYDAGARIFLEIGPGLVLSGLVDRILADRPHTALGLDAPGRAGWLQLSHVLTQLFALGVPVRFEAWFKRRGLKGLPTAELFARARAKANPGPLIWRVNGGRAVPWREPAETSKNVVPLPTATKPSAVSSEGAAAQGTSTRPPLALVQDFPSNTRRYSVMNPEASNSAKPGMGPPTGAGPTAPDPRFSLIQNCVAQLIDLQREQQRTLCSFLDFLHANLANAPGSAEQWTAASMEASAAEPQAVATAAASGGAVLNSVPPAPVLPLQLRTGSPYEAAGERPRSVIPTPAVRSGGPAATKPNGSTGPAPQAVAKAPAGSGSSLAPTEQFKADLLRSVSERTGYPEDMLDLNAHMEADLGIDSIKRIEVFSALKDHHNLLEGRDEETVLEELSGLKTLNEIIAWYDRLREPKPAEGGADSPKKSQTPPSISPVEVVESKAYAEQPDPVDCYVLKPVPAPLQGTAAITPATPSIMLLLGYPSELGEALRAALNGLGHVTRLLVPGRQTRAVDDELFEVNLSSTRGLDGLSEQLKATGKPLGGLINLLSAETPEGTGNDPLPEARALFLSLKALEQNFKEAPGGGWLINLTSLDGQFGLKRSRLFRAEPAGVLGVAKCAYREWPHLKVKCIDLDPGLSTRERVEKVVAELRSGDPTLEIGYNNDGRWRLDLQQRQDPGTIRPELELDPGAVVLVTGGAYGITADILKGLARNRRLRLAVVGRSPTPEPESPTTRDIADPDALRQFLIGEMRRESGKVKPAEVETVLRRILKERQIRSNLAAFREAGGEVDYHALDVRDAAAFGRMIEDVYARWGRIDGVLHGAGIIDDKLIRAKTAESFDAVYDTKVIPALTLARKLDPAKLKFLVFFSSVAGRFGNVGQCDYSAANEVLNKLADRLTVEWPNVHTVSINWGPWDSGMVNDELRKLYASRNIRPIPVETGVRKCLEVLERRDRQEPELVITASVEAIAGIGRSSPSDKSVRPAIDSIDLEPAVA
ncbi:type I fatty acid synthase ArsA [Methylocaldum marinum]|uniref:Type I fatty acid synthase ArsA n=1 Tax=Methylocaldum marinum TaxID=1432792 RepID=A0A250KWY0_9GAMM|nr:type I polyketide synthase [Methylocaldum marinum]BBA36102.1 type I fatty acid synthase ArsA [Methylocaldum marinum]